MQGKPGFDRYAVGLSGMEGGKVKGTVNAPNFSKYDEKVQEQFKPDS